jgi:uncharacterized protein YndB with AHSA1/START domain
MTATVRIPPIIKSIRVRATPERAFKVFTTNVIRWWPPDYTIGTSPMKDIVLEPRDEGRWYEIGEDGSQCQWGDVLVWNPPTRLLLAWRIRLDWTFDPSLLTEIEITFNRLDTGETEVRIEHSKFENLGDDAGRALEIFDGWSSVLARYAEVLAAD